jgi:hypothetical protein
MTDTMSTTEPAPDRDRTTGRFVAGNSGNGGRKPGARGKLGSLFVEDLHRVWQDVGEDALRRCAADDPGQFLRVVASLLPKDVSLTVGLDATSFASAFVLAATTLGVEPKKQRPALPGQPKVIEHVERR